MPRIASTVVPSLDSQAPVSTSSCLLTLTGIRHTASGISGQLQLPFHARYHTRPYGVTRGISEHISIIFYIGFITITVPNKNFCRSQCPRRLRRGYAAARVLGLRVRIPPGCTDVCCVLSGRSQWRADHSSREALPTVVRRRVQSRNLVNEEALVRFAHSGTGRTRSSVKNYDA
jgi:hypothetical protein